MAYNKQVNPYGVSSSELGWKGFADGGKHGNPGAVQVKDNPYAKYTAQMVGDIAWNAGKELTSPEYQGVDALTGKDVYEQNFGRYIFGTPTLPENSYYKRNEEKVHDSFNKNEVNREALRVKEAQDLADAAARKPVIPTTKGAPLAVNPASSGWDQFGQGKDLQEQLRASYYGKDNTFTGPDNFPSWWKPDYFKGKEELDSDSAHALWSNWLGGESGNNNIAGPDSPARLYFSDPKNSNQFPMYQKDPKGFFQKYILPTLNKGAK